MIPTLLKSGIILYVIIQVMVAFIALLLAVRWNKFEFLAGLICIFLYTVTEMVTTFVFVNIEGVYLDVAQFGFILLAILFFIIGMHPSLAPRLASGMKEQCCAYKPNREETLISILRK